MKLDNHPPPSARAILDSRAPLFLESNGVVYLSFPIVADWVQVRRQQEGEEPKGVWIARPLFHRPDKYAVKCSLRLGEGRGRLEQTIHMEVRETQEDDAKVLRELIKDEAVITAAMRAGDAPEEAVMLKLRGLCDQYPNSSYEDYLRFALARGYKRGVGVDPAQKKSGAELAAVELRKIVEHRWDAQREVLVPSRFAYLPGALLLQKWAEGLDRDEIMRRALQRNSYGWARCSDQTPNLSHRA